MTVRIFCNGELVEAFRDAEGKWRCGSCGARVAVVT